MIELPLKSAFVESSWSDASRPAFLRPVARIPLFDGIALLEYIWPNAPSVSVSESVKIGRQISIQRQQPRHSGWHSSPRPSFGHITEALARRITHLPPPSLRFPGKTGEEIDAAANERLVRVEEKQRTGFGVDKQNRAKWAQRAEGDFQIWTNGVLARRAQIKAIEDQHGRIVSSLQEGIHALSGIVLGLPDDEARDPRSEPVHIRPQADGRYDAESESLIFCARINQLAVRDAPTIEMCRAIGFSTEAAARRWASSPTYPSSLKPDAPGRRHTKDAPFVPHFYVADREWAPTPIGMRMRQIAAERVLQSSFWTDERIAAEIEPYKTQIVRARTAALRWMNSLDDAGLFRFVGRCAAIAYDLKGSQASVLSSQIDG